MEFRMEKRDWEEAEVVKELKTDSIADSFVALGTMKR